MKHKEEFVLLILIFSSALFCTSEGHGRNKRELKFPKGTSFVTAVALTSFLPKGITDGMAHILEFDVGFPFPERFAVDFATSKKKNHKPLTYLKLKDHYYLKKYKKKRSLKDVQRMNLKETIEDAINRVGYDGLSCTRRFQCEVKYLESKNSFLEELILTLFKMPSTFTEQICEEAQIKCPFSLLHVISHSQQI